MLRPPGPKPHFLIGSILLAGQKPAEHVQRWAAAQYWRHLLLRRQRLKSVSFSIEGRRKWPSSKMPTSPAAGEGHAVVQFKDVQRNKFIAVAVDGR